MSHPVFYYQRVLSEGFGTLTTMIAERHVIRDSQMWGDNDKQLVPETQVYYIKEWVV